MSIDRGSSWGGDYSRFTFDEQRRYYAMLKERGRAVLDDEFNVLQDMLLTFIRRSVSDISGSSGSPNNGFRIVGSGLANNFTITGGGGTVDTAGVLYVGGLRLILPSDITYLTQEIAGPALTPPPSGTRADTVYCDAWLDEVGPSADPSMVDPTLNEETSRRLRLRYMIRVAQGAAEPAPYVDSSGLQHFIAPLATINRTTSALINTLDVVDRRGRISIAGRLVDALLAHNQDGSAHRMASTEQSGFVKLADASEAIDGESTSLANSPFSTQAQIDATLAGALDGAGVGALVPGVNGREILPSGRIEQWGYIATSLDGEISVPLVFPLAFPNACWNVQAIVVLNPANSIQNSDLFMQTLPPTRTGVELYLQRPSGGGSAAIQGIFWRAVGN